MKNTKLMKLIASLIIGVMLIFVATNVHAADITPDGFELIVPENNTTDKKNETNTNSNKNNTNSTNTNNTNSNNTNSINNTNASVYNNMNSNTNLPKTGVEDSVPAVLLIVVCGISAIYAYKKIKDYGNI